VRRKTIFWIVLGMVFEKILQHSLTAAFLLVSIDRVTKPNIGNRIPLTDPVMAVLNLIVMGFFVWGFWDIRKYRLGGLQLAVIFSFFDIVAEFVFHGFGFITISVVVAIFLIVLALIPKIDQFQELISTRQAI
jgi:hypothetical protein